MMSVSVGLGGSGATAFAVALPASKTSAANQYFMRSRREVFPCRENTMQNTKFHRGNPGVGGGLAVFCVRNRLGKAG